MFENLSDRLQGVMHKIKGYGKITEDNINEDKINQDKTDYDPVLTCEDPLDYLESLKDIPLSQRGNNDFDRSEK